MRDKLKMLCHLPSPNSWWGHVPCRPSGEGQKSVLPELQILKHPPVYRGGVSQKATVMPGVPPVVVGAGSDGAGQGPSSGLEPPTPDSDPVTTSILDTVIAALVRDALGRAWSAWLVGLRQPHARPSPQSSSVPGSPLLSPRSRPSQHWAVGSPWMSWL